MDLTERYLQDDEIRRMIVKRRLQGIIRALDKGEYDWVDIEAWLDDGGFPE